jgi:hypothetical protein
MHFLYFNNKCIIITKTNIIYDQYKCMSFLLTFFEIMRLKNLRFSFKRLAIERFDIK